MTSANQVLQVEIQNKESLHSAYMPFIKDGGLFLPTNIELDMGDRVLVILKLPFDKSEHQFMANVVWLSPAGYNKSKPPGVGVRIDPKVGGNTFMARAEKILGALTASPKPTFTM